MNHFTEAFVTIILAIVGLAVVSVLVSKNAQTASVAQALSSGIGNNIATAISPVTGSGGSPNLSYPGSSSYGYGFGS